MTAVGRLLTSILERKASANRRGSRRLVAGLQCSSNADEVGLTMTKKYIWALAALVAGQVMLTDALFAKSPNSDWAHEHSDLKPDPGIQFGKLPNGMRYAIFKNATPPGQASIRLRIGSGSLNESDAQQGLAHFLEHMAFKGSKRVPEGEMIKILQRKGLAFGPDTNAFTSWTQTVYMLDLPQADASTIDTAFMLMRETASELTLDEKSMEPERNVVLSEERVRDTPGYRATKARYRYALRRPACAKPFSHRQKRCDQKCTRKPRQRVLHCELSPRPSYADRCWRHRPRRD